MRLPWKIYISIEATEEYGFDTSTCCIISELSEKLDIPFASLLSGIFDMMVDYRTDPDYISARLEYAIDLGVSSMDELNAICKYYNCEYYEISFRTDTGIYVLTRLRTHQRSNTR